MHKQQPVLPTLSMLSSTVLRTRAAVVARHYSRTAMVRSEPKVHKATGNWDALKSKRPVDADDLHVSPERIVILIRACDAIIS
jgi:hypothetical protein